jgi:ClpP class serine protease
VPSTQPELNAQREKRPVLALADGRVFSAKHALAAGLIDQIGYEADAYDKAAELAHVRDPKIVLYKPKTSVLAEILTGSSESAAEMQRLRGSMRQIESVLSSQPMYLCPTQNFVQNWPIMNYAQP